MPCSRRDGAPRSSTPLVEGDLDRDSRRASRRAARARRRAAGGPRPSRPPRVRRRPARAADGRGRRPRSSPPTPRTPHAARPPHRRRERRLAAAVGGLAIVGATTSMAVAAQTALPGDSLYPRQAAIENAAHRPHASARAARASTLLANASGRLDEVDALSRERRPAATSAASPTTLDDFTDQAIEASDLLLADYASTGDEPRSHELRDFAAASLDQLAALEPLVPAEARDELIRRRRRARPRSTPRPRRPARPAAAAGITEIPPASPPVRRGATRSMVRRPDRARPTDGTPGGDRRATRSSGCRHRGRRRGTAAPDERHRPGARPADTEPADDSGGDRAPGDVAPPTGRPDRATARLGETGRRAPTGGGDGRPRRRTVTDALLERRRRGPRRPGAADGLDGDRPAAPGRRLSGRRTAAASAASRASAGSSRAPGRSR